MFTIEKFLEKFEKVPVIEYENSVVNDPLVSVCIQTYQHSKYIKLCLDGILAQKTTFKYEILLGEDESNDGTREICLDYANKYPDKIRLFLHNRANNMKVYNVPTGKFNFTYNMYNAKGKYITICEGDDFWTDTHKLEKQVKFLENNQDHTMVFSDITMIDESNTKLEDREYHKKIKALYKSGDIFWDLLKNNFINTLTVDYRLWLHVASYGKIEYMNEDTASYRVHSLGISRVNNFFSKRTPLVRQSSLVHYMSLIDYKVNLIDKNILSEVIFSTLRNKNLNLKEKQPIISLIKNKPIYILYILKWISKRIFHKFF